MPPDHDDARPLKPQRLLLWLGLVVGFAVIAVWWSTPPKPDPVAPAAPPPPPIVKPAAPPRSAPPLTPAPLPVITPVVPVPEPQPTPVQPPLQSIILADGRHFIGIHDPDAGTIAVQAAIRGGKITRMQAITLKVETAAITSVSAYDGGLGDFSAPYVPAPADPAHALVVANAREAAAAQAEVRRHEAAEKERIRVRIERQAVAANNLTAAKAAVVTATKREQFLADHATTLADERHLKLELVNGLQLQMNTAQDRWNLELQTNGPRVTKPDGTSSGGPTAATEALVANLQNQIRQARQAIAAADQTLRTEAAERQNLHETMAQRTEAVEAAVAAQAALEP